MEDFGEDTEESAGTLTAVFEDIHVCRIPSRHMPG
jgi:hypothetical protein